MNYRKTLSIIVAALVIAGLLPFHPDVTHAASNQIEKVIRVGKSYLGTPYEFGSNRRNTRTFDCSDFTRQAFLEGAKVRIPNNSRAQAKYVKNIGDTTKNWKKLDKGDLMFFMKYKGSDASDYRGKNKSKERVTHVGIYLGNGRVLHTYSEDHGVTISSIDNTHWEYRFLFGGSAIK